MKDKHIFSNSYTERKKALLHAIRREEHLERRRYSHGISRMPLRVMVTAVVLCALTISVCAAAQWIEFRMEQSGDEVRIFASLNENEEDRNGTKVKPLRSWVNDEGEFSVCLYMPDLPADMHEDKTAIGKYGSEDGTRSITVNAIDLRRSDLNQLIKGATATEKLSVGGKTAYVITKGEADFYNRIVYVIYEKEELVLKMWVSYGITDGELLPMLASLTVEETTDTLKAIPILNELNNTSDNMIPDVICRDEVPVNESELSEIGETIRSEGNAYTVTVDNVAVYDHINVLRKDCMLRESFVKRFTDVSGKLIPYNRTEVLWEGEECKHFGETVSALKKLYVVTLTMTDAADEEMTEAFVYGFRLKGYSTLEGKIAVTLRSAVVDGKPGATADSSEIIYREYMGNCQWKVAYLIDEDIAEGNLLLTEYSGKVFVKIQ